MLRFISMPLIILILLLLTVIITWVVYKKIKKGIGYTVKKGTELATDQQQKWAKKEQHKKLPTIFQKGFSDYDKIYLTTQSLPKEWQIAISPIVSTARDILDELTMEFEGENSKNHSKANEDNNKKLNSIRGFFVHSLDALKQFVEKLASDHQSMTVDEIEKARQNITVFKADLLGHQETLHKLRRFDFDVTMDVIKARLKP